MIKHGLAVALLAAATLMVVLLWARGPSPIAGVEVRVLPRQLVAGTIFAALPARRGAILVYEVRSSRSSDPAESPTTHEWMVDPNGVAREIGIVCEGVVRDVANGAKSSRWALCITDGERAEVGAVVVSSEVGERWHAMALPESIRRLVSLPNGTLLAWSNDAIYVNHSGMSWSRRIVAPSESSWFYYSGDAGSDGRAHVATRGANAADLGSEDAIVTVSPDGGDVMHVQACQNVKDLAAIHQGYVYIESGNDSDRLLRVDLSEAVPSRSISWAEPDHRILRMISDGDKVLLVETESVREHPKGDTSHLGLLLVSTDGARTWRKQECSQRREWWRLGRGEFLTRAGGSLEAWRVE